MAGPSVAMPALPFSPGEVLRADRARLGVRQAAELAEAEGQAGERLLVLGGGQTAKAARSRRAILIVAFFIDNPPG